LVLLSKGVHNATLSALAILNAYLILLAVRKQWGQDRKGPYLRASSCRQDRQLEVITFE
jgi:hypothetical protein